MLGKIANKPVYYKNSSFRFRRKIFCCLSQVVVGLIYYQYLTRLDSAVYINISKTVDRLSKMRFLVTNINKMALQKIVCNLAR